MIVAIYHLTGEKMVIEVGKPNGKEISTMLDAIRDFCRREELRNRADFNELAELIAPIRYDELGDPLDGDELQEIEKEQYLNAITALLDMASSTAHEDLDRALSDINLVLSQSSDLDDEADDSPIKGVLIVDPRSMESYDLREQLPRPRSLSEEDRSVVDWFRRQLPNDEVAPERPITRPPFRERGP